MRLSGYVYLCAGGDTFDSAALDVYGDEKYAAELLNANPRYAQRMVFKGGETLALPVIDSGGTAAEAKAPWRTE